MQCHLFQYKVPNWEKQLNNNQNVKNQRLGSGGEDSDSANVFIIQKTGKSKRKKQANNRLLNEPFK